MSTDANQMSLPRRPGAIEKLATAGMWISSAFAVACFFGAANNVYEGWETAQHDPTGQLWGMVYERSINGAEYIFHFLCALAVLACCLIARRVIRRKRP